MTELIRLTKVSKVFPDGHGKELEILTDVNLSFEQGESYCIVGRSGSGKSTLLHLLGGLDHPSSGEVFFEGRSIFTLSPDEIANWRAKSLGFVFQAHHLLPDFTALENTMIPQLILERPQGPARERATKLLIRLGLEHRLHHRPSALSGGEQQRVAIARALVNEPQLVLADEPTGNLDPKTGQTVAELLAEICIQEQRTLILVTHSPDLASQMNHQLRLQNSHFSLLKD